MQSSIGRKHRILQRVRALRRPLVAAATLFLYLANLYHFSSVAHVICPIDGELMHAQVAHHSHPVSDQPALDSTRDDAASHDHEHCALFSPSHNPSIIPKAEFDRVERIPTFIPVVPDRIAPSAISLVLLAPKNSPPELG